MSTFHTGRTLEIYRAGRNTHPAAIPIVAESLEAKARETLSREAFEWIAGGAGSDDTVRANREAFLRWRIVPRVLCNVAERDWSLTLGGDRLPAPLLLAPVGLQQVAHPLAELPAARAAAALGLVFVASTVTSRTMEEIALEMDAAAGHARAPRWFQLYWPDDDALTCSFLARAERAGYSAIVVTVDTQTLGWRERNLEQAYMPFLQGQGLANYLSDPAFLKRLPAGREHDPAAQAEEFFRVFSNLRHTWTRLAWLRQQTKLPLWVKGVQHADDARAAFDCGADGLIVSNHGGRQVDGALATLDALHNIMTALKPTLPVLVDGGIRRGAEMFKALALGARAVLVGRPYLYAAAIGGEAGVQAYLANLLADFDVTCALCGKSRLEQITCADLG